MSNEPNGMAISISTKVLKFKAEQTLGRKIKTGELNKVTEFIVKNIIHNLENGLMSDALTYCNID